MRRKIIQPAVAGSRLAASIQNESNTKSTSFFPIAHCFRKKPWT
jgi:hypothetical protein